MIDFLKYRPICAVFSALIFVAFIGTFAYKRFTRGEAFTYSVEFTGGTEALFKFEKPVKDVDLKRILAQAGWNNAVTRTFAADEILVRVKEFSSDIKGLGQQMLEAIKKEMPDNQVTLLSIDSLSGSMGAILRLKSFYAIMLALLLMFAYIWGRFWSLSFGMGAMISLLHDAVVILLIFMLFDKEMSINVIGAILTILGYSINDTIVIFARIRDNLKTMRGVPAAQIVNLSINQTLRRSLLTSFATLLVVISLIVLGGEALRDLSLSLLIGIVFGTYSSIYIASPVMLLLYREAR
jgi:preprotein translocase SecF subunit